MNDKLHQHSDVRTTPDDIEAIIQAKRAQVRSTPYGWDWRRAKAEADRYADIGRAERLQPRVWPPPPGPSAFQRAAIARHRQHHIEVLAARWLQRRTPGSGLLGLLVVAPGQTRFGMTCVATAPRVVRRTRQRAHRSHRTVARATVGGDSGDGEPPEPEPPSDRHHLTSEVVPC